ncbi:pre-rRNA-processing protein pno1, partial [Spiromyces aspiralis]
MNNGRPEFRKIRIPSHRYGPLKENWLKIYTPIVEHLKLQIRFNPKQRLVEIRTCNQTTDPGAIQKAADFIRAFALGFEVDDAMALLRLDDLYIESFEIKD